VGFFWPREIAHDPAEAEQTVREQPRIGPQCVDETGPGQPIAYCGDLVTLAAINVREAELTLVSDELTVPWSFEFIDDETLLINEYAGNFKRLNVKTGAVTALEGRPDLVSGKGQTGLLDLALHPRFETNRTIYFSYTITRKEDDVDKYALAVARATLGDSSVDDIEQIFVATPFARSKSNFGGALAFDSDGYLYVTTGDRTGGKRAQHKKNLNGKIVRLLDDGGIPRDNPFVGDKSYHPAIYALGVRNPQGLVIDPVTGIMYEAEHGPMGGDEVNVIEAGRNYGWPVVTYGMWYTYKEVGVGTAAPGYEQPLFYYLPSIAASPLEIYRGDMFPEWEGDLLVGALRGQLVSKLDLVEGRIISEARILDEIGGPIRDLKVARDGSIFLASNRGEIYRLSRSTAQIASVATSELKTGAQVYKAYCASCHSVLGTEVPSVRTKADWSGRLAKGREALYRTSIEGIGRMPARGFCEDCSDDQIKLAVDHMIELVEGQSR
jgi:glucose/arabinose dehydrogenase